MNSTKALDAKKATARPTSENTPIEAVRRRIQALKEAWSRRERTVPQPRPEEVHAPRASWLGSVVAARLAARADVPLAEFLRHRLALRLGALTVHPARLPITFQVDEAGTLATRPAPDSPRPAWLDTYLRAHGNAAIREEVQIGQADLARLAVRIDAQRRRVDEVTRDLDAAARNAAPADPEDEVQARHMGRPPVPPPAGMALQAFALLLILALSGQIAVPCLEAAGIGLRELTGELTRNPVTIALCFLFALGAALSLFLLAHLALRRAVAALDAIGDARRPVWTALLATLAVLVEAGLAACLARATPVGAHHLEPEVLRMALFIVALAVPFVAAWLARLGRELEVARAGAATAARAWDMEHFRAYAELTRRAAIVRDEEASLARMEGQRQEIAGRLHRLQNRAATAERFAADAVDREAQELARAAQTLSAALDLDRYEFLRQTASFGRDRPLTSLHTPRPQGEGVERSLGLVSS